MGDGIKDAFIIYLNDDDFQKKAYVTILEMNAGFIKFKTNAGNIITLPVSRLIKLKEFEENGS